MRAMRILSGIQPSGEPHLGNYFGAMRQHVELQAKGEAIYFLADYHSMTSIRDADERRRFTHELALDYLALGLDPARAARLRQSSRAAQRSCLIQPAIRANTAETVTLPATSPSNTTAGASPQEPRQRADRSENFPSAVVWPGSIAAAALIAAMMAVAPLM